MKVLHLPSSTGGNAWGLAEGERALGLDSTVLVANQNWLGYPADIELLLEGRSSAAKLLSLTAAFLRVRRRFQVLHFNAGMSLIHSPHLGLNQLDVPFYPERTALFVTYNGCDARQKYATIARTSVSACHMAACYHGLCEYGRYDELRARAITKMARYVKHLWALNPDLLHFLPAEKSSFLPYTVASGHFEWRPANTARRRLRIVHAPTNRAAKGSAHILAALDRLRVTHGDRFELQVIEGVPHAEAMRLYAEADLIIDQILIGWYGAFAVETMAMGKPVIARIARDDLRYLPLEMADEVTKAVIHADPNTIEEVLRRCIEDREFLALRAEAGAAYARRWHDPLYVAGITKRAYESVLCTT
jgi:nucleotide-binding universal stress UspA family protein